MEGPEVLAPIFFFAMVTAIAVEVERISEGQRFTTRLLSESKNANALSASSRSSD